LDQGTSEDGGDQSIAALGILVGRAIGVARLKRSAVNGQSGNKDGDDRGDLHFD